MKIALVHDYLVQHGGAERVLRSFAEVFPEAPIYTLMHDGELMRGTFDDREIVTSSLQRWSFVRKHHRNFPPFMPAAIEEFDFSDFDVVLSDSSSFAKGIITRPETLHLSYVHTPMRYAWDDCQKYTSDFGLPRLVESIVPFFMNGIRLWDYASAQRVDHYFANSEFVAKRIKKYYHKDAEVINPPVEIGDFVPVAEEEVQDYYLMVGRLIAYKRHDIAIDAFNKLGLPLKIIGRGPEMSALQKMANDNITFLGRVPDEKLSDYYAKCKGFIFPQEEDFGIVAIEALASGRPIIAFNGGDIAEHVEDGLHGVLFDQQTANGLVGAIERAQGIDFESAVIREASEKFDSMIFKRTIKSRVEELLAQHMTKISNREEQHRAFLSQYTKF